MKRKISLQFLLIAALAIIFTATSTSIIFYEILKKEVMGDLKNYAHVLEKTGIYNNYKYDSSDTNSNTSAASTDSENSKNSITSYDNNLRITLINKDGTVLMDSEADISKMNNHKKRNEIAKALKYGEGKAIRHSDTLNKNTFYYAIRLSDGNVLRISKETNSILSICTNSLPIIIGIIIVLFILCFILSWLLTKSLMKPIEQMADNIDNCSDILTYKEFKPFLSTIQKQHDDIIKNANMRQEFTANISHELKTPLTSISGYSELIENGMAGEEDIIRFASEIHKNSNRLLTLINDIIRLSELDSSQQDVSFETINLQEICKNCVEMLELNASKHNIKLFQLGSAANIHGNRQMIEELIYNLCDNAIRYNNENGTVWVTTEIRNGHSVVSVKDNGIGISKENQERIFERFYRVDKSRSKSTGGTGLGLAIVKHIIAQHPDAELKIESEEGKGTEIIVSFDYVEV